MQPEYLSSSHSGNASDDRATGVLLTGGGVDGGSGPRITPSPLEQARVEALLISEILREWLKRPLPVAPALALFDMEPDRRIECLARQSRVPLLWDLEGCTGRLAARPRINPLRRFRFHN